MAGGAADRRLDGPPAVDRWPDQPPDPHFGIDGECEFVLLTGDPAPVGGSLASAHRELACATELVAHGAPSVVPVAVIGYLDASFDHAGVRHPLGVAITGSPVDSMHRCSVVLARPDLPAAAMEAELARLVHALGLQVDRPASAEGRLRILGQAYRRFGETLRGFSAAGWYRYSGHADNIVIDDRGRAVLVDLDSCRPVDPARPDLAFLEAVRDGMSGLYNLACGFFPSAALDGVTDDDLAAFEPFSSFLDGWADEQAGCHGPTGAALARYVIASRQQLRHFGDFLRAGVPASDHLYRHVRHDRDLTFIWLYRIAYSRRLAGRDAAAAPFDLAALDERLLRFAGRERWLRMQQLDEECT